MNIFFLLNNFHFALEIFGALVFGIISWVSFDAYFLRKNFLTASRGFGFLILTAWQILHAFGTGGSFVYLGFLLYIFGLFLVFLSFVLERPIKRPSLQSVLILPSLTETIFYTNITVATLYFIIAVLAFRQYKTEFKKSLRPFWIGFLFLTFGATASVFYNHDSLNRLWMLGHGLETIGFGFLVWWVWQYLRLRLHEQMMAIFVSGALLISIMVTLAFSFILVNQMENSAKANLLTNVKVLDLAVSRFSEEALTKAKFISRSAGFENLILEKDIAKLEEVSSKYLTSEKLGFLIVLDKNGEVILRAHALSQRDDDLSGETAVKEALLGNDFVTVEFSPAEKFSIRAASPVQSKNEVVGVIVAGFLLDNVFADNMKRITGLEMSILDKENIVATTLLNQDGKTRSVGVKITDNKVISSVLEKGNEIVLRTEILSRPALASYIPIRNAEGSIVGMLSAVKPQQEILSLAGATNRLTLMTIAILMFVLILPIYLITKKLTDENI